MSDEVILSRADAESIWAALDVARGYHIADDLTKEYKNVGGTHRPSNLTKRIENAIALLDEAASRGDEDGADAIPNA